MTLSCKLRRSKILSICSFVLQNMGTQIWSSRGELIHQFSTSPAWLREQNTVCQPRSSVPMTQIASQKTNSTLPLVIFRGQTQNQAGKNETVNTRCVVDGRSSSDLRPTLGRRVGRRQLEAAYQAAVTAVNTRAQLLTIYPRVKHSCVYCIYFRTN